MVVGAAVVVVVVGSGSSVAGGKPVSPATSSSVYPRAAKSSRPASSWQAVHCSASSAGATMWVIGQYISLSMNPISPL